MGSRRCEPRGVWRLLSLLCLCFLALPAQAEPGDVVIDRQQGIGPIHFDMLEAEIRGLGPIDERYDFYRRKAWGATSVWPDDPFRRITAVLSDPPDDRPAYLVVKGFGSKYVLRNGLRLGSSLAEVEKANGRPFAFRGMGQDDAGEVLDWCGGRLAQELPGVILSFHPLGSYAEGMSESQLEQVVKGLSTSDAPIWKELHLEVGEIRIARPDPAPISGPLYAEPQEMEHAEVPEAALEFLAGRGRHSLFQLSGGKRAVLIECLDDDAVASYHTFVSLLRASGSGFEVVTRGELEFEWFPERLLAFGLQEGGPDRGLVLADSGALMTVVRLYAEEPARSYSFSLAWSDEPHYRLVRNERGMLEVRQRWSMPGPEERDGATDYFWDGEFFRFPDGSKSQ